MKGLMHLSRSNLLSTKVGFGKLKRMKEEMDSLSSIGGDIEDLRRLVKKVIIYYF